MDYIKKLKKDSRSMRTTRKRPRSDLQELTDKYIKKVDDACAVKEKGTDGDLIRRTNVIPCAGRFAALRRMAFILCCF